MLMREVIVNKTPMWHAAYTVAELRRWEIILSLFIAMCDPALIEKIFMSAALSHGSNNYGNNTQSGYN